MAGNWSVLVSEREPSRFSLYLSTCWELLTLFTTRGRYFLIPLLLILLLTAVLLVLSEMVPVLAPFVYTIF